VNAGVPGGTQRKSGLPRIRDLDLNEERHTSSGFDWPARRLRENCHAPSTTSIGGACGVYGAKRTLAQSLPEPRDIRTLANGQPRRSRARSSRLVATSRSRAKGGFGADDHADRIRGFRGRPRTRQSLRNCGARRGSGYETRHPRCDSSMQQRFRGSRHSFRGETSDAVDCRSARHDWQGATERLCRSFPDAVGDCAHFPGLTRCNRPWARFEPLLPARLEEATCVARNLSPRHSVRPARPGWAVAGSTKQAHAEKARAFQVLANLTAQRVDAKTRG